VTLATINGLLAAKNCNPLTINDIATGPAQLKAMVDLCHLYGIAVVFDVVYNHAGGFEGDDQSLYFWDRYANGDNNQSLYFKTGGKSCAVTSRARPSSRISSSFGLRPALY
jgi:1,4-alpha-glucan branching enzyme